MSGDNGYMTRYSRTKKDEGSPEVELADIVAKLKAKGLSLAFTTAPFGYTIPTPMPLSQVPTVSPWSSLRYNRHRHQRFTPYKERQIWLGCHRPSWRRTVLRGIL